MFGMPSIGIASTARLEGPLPNMQSSVGSAMAVMVSSISGHFSRGSQLWQIAQALTGQPVTGL